MSSIYRKGGASGYYYYQTYIYNSKSGKKDKRIFHSLGTRDINEAEAQQAELDIKYEAQENADQSTSKFSILVQNKRTIALVVGTALLTVLIVNLFQTKPPLPQKKFNKQVEAPAAKAEEVIMPTVAEKTADEVKQPETKAAALVVTEAKPAPKIEKLKLTIPMHTVVRIENISDVFEQGKVYVTVNEKASAERLLMLCKSLAGQYTEFSNIVICLYASSDVGTQLAKGTGSNFSLKEQNEAWLVLYSYNPVEGEYYDDEPGKYLGS